MHDSSATESPAFRLIMRIIAVTVGVAVFAVACVFADRGDGAARGLAMSLVLAVVAGPVLGTLQLILEPLGKRYPFFKI